MDWNPFRLGRYDGHELKKYVHQADDPHSIPHNFIYQMIEDEQNNIWILTDKGVARYRRQSDDFFIPTNESGNNIIVYSVCLTKAASCSVQKIKSFSIIIRMLPYASCNHLSGSRITMSPADPLG